MPIQLSAFYCQNLRYLKWWMKLMISLRVHSTHESMLIKNVLVEFPGCIAWKLKLFEYSSLCSSVETLSLMSVLHSFFIFTITKTMLNSEPCSHRIYQLLLLCSLTWWFCTDSGKMKLWQKPVCTKFIIQQTILMKVTYICKFS